ncbi:hypothetical protein FQN60_002112, partial [Etheostoma spectabile]
MLQSTLQCHESTSPATKRLRVSAEKFSSSPPRTPVDVNNRVHSLEKSVDGGAPLLPRCLSFWLLAWDHATPQGVLLRCHCRPTTMTTRKLGMKRVSVRSARLTGGSIQQIPTRPKIRLRKGRLWGRQGGRRRDTAALVVVRSENEAISKYTAAEILRNRGPGISDHEREDKMHVSIVANMDPTAT